MGNQLITHSLEKTEKIACVKFSGNWSGSMAIGTRVAGQLPHDGRGQFCS